MPKGGIKFRKRTKDINFWMSKWAIYSAFDSQFFKSIFGNLFAILRRYDIVPWEEKLHFSIIIVHIKLNRFLDMHANIYCTVTQ